ncbi:MAG: hypothetical protein MUF10_03295 [Thermoanaerobaculaceae bacterium]|jgi:hypothetical protein|nr:hypothetical protein [Thermoanaerobaculaceae bacterium]
MRRSFLVVMALLAMAAAVPTVAQPVVSETAREGVRGVPDRWGLNLGSFWQTFNTKIRADGKNGQGSDIDFEDELGLPSSATNFDLAGFYRISDRHRVDLAYLGWNRENSRTLEREIVWEDVTYDVGVTVKSKFEGRMVNAIYKYSFFNNGKVTFGLNGGISALWSDAKLTGEGTVSGGGTASGTVAESSSVVVPIPVVGMHFEMTLAKRFFWRVDGNFFAADLSGYDGHVNELSTSLNYFFTRNIGVGAGFASNTIKVKKDGDNGDVNVRVGFSGAVANVMLAF